YSGANAINFWGQNRDFQTNNGTATLVTGTWYHISVTYDGANVAIYLNGVLKGIKAMTLDTAAAPIVMGATDAGGSKLRGYMDEFMVFNRALNINEIKALVTLTSATKLVWSEGGTSVAAGDCVKYVITAQDASSNMANSFASKDIEFTGVGSAGLYSNATCASALQTNGSGNKYITMAAGSSYVNVYLKDTTSETLNLVARDTSVSSALTSGLLTVNVNAALPSGLVLHYDMNESNWAGVQNEIHDSSGSGNHGYSVVNSNDPVNANTSGAEGINSSRSGYFVDGTDNVSTNANSAITGTSARTIAFWVKLSTLDDFNGLFYMGNNSADGKAFGLRHYSGANAINFWGQNRDFQTDNGTAALVTGTWYHIAVKFVGGSPGTVTIYLNGSALNVSGGASSVVLDTAAAPIVVGAAEGGGYKLRGYMDEFMVFNRALSGAEISDLYSRGP
ncbi:MAG: LamG domain-containing protein, partial [Bdellovibrionota bacterium]